MGGTGTTGPSAGDGPAQNPAGALNLYLVHDILHVGGRLQIAPLPSQCNKTLYFIS